MTGIVPAGRGNASELKYPPDTRYDQTLLGAADNDAFAPNRPPAPLPTPDPASRLMNPPVNDASPPGASRGDLVMMLTTPVMAFAPQTADAGPRMTSICWISFMFAGSRSHSTMPKKSR